MGGRRFDSKQKSKSNRSMTRSHSKTNVLRRKKARTRKGATKLSLESLEDRQLLDANGVWFSDTRFSISFVPDGTAVGPKESELFAEFEHLGEPAVWQETIVQAFQTWAQTTPFDVAVVDETLDEGVGLPTGISGTFKGDVRFGDVRVAAIPFERDDLFSTSIEIDVFQGTWAGDVFFNTRVDIESLDQLFSLALHEAGHIFGLAEHNDIPGSPLNVSGPPVATALTQADFDALQALHGLRPADPFELEVVVDSVEPVATPDPEDTIDVPPDGDIPTTSDPGVFHPIIPDADPEPSPDSDSDSEPTPDSDADPDAAADPDDSTDPDAGSDPDPPPSDPPEDSEDPDGSVEPDNTDPTDSEEPSDPSESVATGHITSLEIASPSGEPTIIFADIQSAEDTDTFRLTSSDPDTELVSVRLVTEEISSLRPTLSLLGQDGEELATRSNLQRSELGLLIDLREFAEPEGGFVVEIAAEENSAPNDAGGYSLLVTRLAQDPEAGMTDDELSHPTFCETVVAQARTRSRSVAGNAAKLAECNGFVDENPNLPEPIIESLVGNRFGDPVLNPEPIDPTEHAFCGHDFLNDLYTCLVKGDINGDGKVDFVDFLQLSDNFGEDDADRGQGDVTGDSKVDFADFLVVSRNFGQPPSYELDDESPGGFFPFS